MDPITPGDAEVMAGRPMLEMRGITKRFPGVIANDHVDFDLRAGEVHTLLGENGAGKSTLMRILYGLYRADEGEIRLNGIPMAISSPADAIGHGIGMIHQHFMLVPTLTVAENVALGLRSPRAPLTDLDHTSERIEELSHTYGLKVDPKAFVWQLAVGERQRVEIIKALYRNASLLILDEPTAVLTPQEVDDLFAVFRQMTEDGRGLVFISHKIREVMALSDRVTVLRGGRVVGTVRPSEVSRQDLAHMMVGREVGLVQNAGTGSAGEVRLSVRDLTVPGDRGADAVRNVSFEVRSGEIVSIAGVSGNGQRELTEAIAGLRAPSGGTILFDGVESEGRDPAQVRASGIAYVPEERMRDGVIGDFSVADNLMLIDHRASSFSWWGFLRGRDIQRHCADLVSAYQVKTPGLETPAHNLSGGNIQKLILARELSGSPRVLLVAQPTRGIDVGSTEYIHHRLIEQRGHGTAILIISEDLDEALALSDRILVMYEGAVIGEVDDPRSATREQIGLMMAGVRPGHEVGPVLSAPPRDEVPTIT
jgi:ABC-type uncharacterized transport system ATPase subunit